MQVDKKKQLRVTRSETRWENIKVRLLHICMLICGSIEVVNVIWWILQQAGEWPVNGKLVNLLVNGNSGECRRVTAAAIFTFHCPPTHSHIDIYPNICLKPREAMHYHPKDRIILFIYSTFFIVLFHKIPLFFGGKACCRFSCIMRPYLTMKRCKQ